MGSAFERTGISCLGELFAGEAPTSASLHFRVLILLHSGAEPDLAQVCRAFRQALQSPEMRALLLARSLVLWQSGAGFKFSREHCRRTAKLSADMRTLIGPSEGCDGISRGSLRLPWIAPMFCFSLERTGSGHHAQCGIATEAGFDMMAEGGRLFNRENCEPTIFGVDSADPAHQFGTTQTEAAKKSAAVGSGEPLLHFALVPGEGTLGSFWVATKWTDTETFDQLTCLSTKVPMTEDWFVFGLLESTSTGTFKLVPTPKEVQARIIIPNY
eukprot:TRINITY_DN19847_c0_g1_i2.p1 TRINITY_DN19847_c0_g1~~TRINITY_DN19847_c0_g1_i2.p1  ORF type:complete len:271 (-),score=31.03 TRINITY_DN19847_c0_g1_i2:117-929(-)